MKAKRRSTTRVVLTSGLCFFVGVAVAILRPSSDALGDPPIWHTQDYCGFGDELPSVEVGGCWYWMRSPEQEKRVVMALFNRYCIRCHGVDGRGVWDIPDVPNFTNPRWQACRTDGELARAILEGRGSVMPPWRGTLSLEEAYAIARYVRTFVPGSEMSRPDFGGPETQGPQMAPPPPGASPPPAPPVRTPPMSAPPRPGVGMNSYAPQAPRYVAVPPQTMPYFPPSQQITQMAPATPQPMQLAPQFSVPALTPPNW